jgi:hypothetical protein
MLDIIDISFEVRREILLNISTTVPGSGNPDRPEGGLHSSASVNCRIDILYSHTSM